METKLYTNLDILRKEIMDTKWVAKILNCSPSTVSGWARKGMPSSSDYLGSSIYPVKRNLYYITDVLKWLKENNKTKYAEALEKYLNEPYKCECCLYKLKKSKDNSNNAVLRSDSRYGGSINYLCYDCYMDRIASEELNIYEENGVLKTKTIYYVVEEDWDTYEYALEFAKYKNRNMRMIVDKENEETIFIFDKLSE